MNQSPEISKLAGALSKAQGMLNAAKKDSSNPFFKSKYADLESVWDACREALSMNELAIVQCPCIQEQQVCLETILTHSSGEWIKSTMPLLLTKQDPQTMGSALTYARRYALAAMVGIVQSDDDGERAMQPARYKKEEPAQDVTLLEVRKEIEKKIKLENPEHLGEYLEFCKERVNKPMKEVMKSWIDKPDGFINHYTRWAEKKVLDNLETSVHNDERKVQVSV